MPWNPTNRPAATPRKPRKTAEQIASELGADIESIQNLGNNRLVLSGDRKRMYVLHSTPVVTHDTKGQRAKINCGGWVTSTTAKAINEGLALFGVPGVVYRDKGELFYRTRDADSEPRKVDTEKGLSVALK